MYDADKKRLINQKYTKMRKQILITMLLATNFVEGAKFWELFGLDKVSDLDEVEADAVP